MVIGVREDGEGCESMVSRLEEILRGEESDLSAGAVAFVAMRDSCSECSYRLQLMTRSLKSPMSKNQARVQYAASRSQRQARSEPSWQIVMQMIDHIVAF